MVASRPALVEALGGRRGLVDSGLPTVVFVVVNPFAGVSTAAWAALGMGIAVVLLRLLRREPPQQAFGGLLALALAAFLAVRFRGGDGSGFFLSGVAFNALYGLVFLGSVCVRRPLVGVIIEALQGRRPRWRADPVLRRAYALATLGWAMVFLARSGIQGAAISAGTDVTWLGVLKLALGYPVTLAAVGLTLLYIRRFTRVGRIG